MSRRVTSVLCAFLIATAAATAVGGAAALNVAGCIWGVLMLGGLVGFLRRDPMDPSPTRLTLLFAVSTGLWLASDALAAVTPAHLGASFPSASEVVGTAGTVGFCVVIAWVGKLRSMWPDLQRQLGGLVFVSSLSVPLWFAVIQPQGASPQLVLWSVSALALLGFGTTYVIGGGLWNVPAILLAVGVTGNVVIDLVLHLLAVGHPGGIAATFAARHGFSFVLWTFVAFSPGLDDIFAGGHRPGGIPRHVRVWFLPACVALPITVLGAAYVDGNAPPMSFALSALAVLGAIIGMHAWLDSRSVEEGWHVSLTIAITTLVAAAAAVCLTLAGQSASRAHAHAARLTAMIPLVEHLDTALLRTAQSSPALAAAPRSDWTRTATTLRIELTDARPQLLPLLADYLVQGAVATAIDRNDPRGADAVARPAYRRLLTAIQATAVRERALARAATRRARLLTVGALLSALVAITLLLLRFSAAGKRLAVAYLERHDALTGLPNRNAVELRLRRGADQLADARLEQSIVLLDLDDFKAVNDVHGHPTGDLLLRAVADRLAGVVHGGELLARVDGDAFAVVIDGVPDPAHALGLARRLAAALDEPFATGESTHVLEGSIGIAVGAEADEETDDEDRALVILRNAELAMYEAKRLPGNAIESFRPSMHEAARDRLALTADLRHALEHDELHLVYQPIVDLQTGCALGYEALARWDHPERGLLAPAEFIPLAEATGLVVPLGGWVLREAARQLQEWQHEWNDRRYVSVNVASRQLAAGVFPDQVRAALEASGLPADQLLIEVTESSLIENVDAALAQMAEIKALGVRFALDDFGTGYSSLSYLRQFRVDVVKVDKSFIDDVVDDEGSSLVEAIVHMAASLRMKVVAEGIEGDDQADELRRLGCELGQGFRYSRPLAAADVMGAPPVFGLPPAATSPLRVQRRSVA